MFSLRGQKNPRPVANDIAREIGRRGFPAKTKTVTLISVTGNIRKAGIVIPGRGVAAVNDDLSIIVASYKKPLPWTSAFEYKSVEADAENILRHLPLS